MDTVLVVGGAGAVGSQLCGALYARGYEVVCIDIMPEREATAVKALLDKPNFQYVRHNAVHPYRANCSCIFHLASYNSEYARQYPVEAYRLEIIGLFNSLEAARSCGATVVYCSSSAVYSYGNGSYDTPQYPIAHIKKAAEGICYSYYKEYGALIHVARLFETYGVGMRIDDHGAIPQMIAAALQNVDIVIHGGSISNRTFCWVSDVVDGLLRLADMHENGKYEVFNFAGVDVVSLDEVASKIITLTRSRSKIIHEKLQSGMDLQPIPDITSARERLGWEPNVTIDEGLSRMIEYVDKQLKIQSSVYKCESWIEFN